MKNQTNNVKLRFMCASALVSIAALSASSAAVAAEDPSPPGGSLEEIVVTAQHRSENLQEVPISVTAITADSLERNGVSGTQALVQMVPAVQMSRAGPAGLFYVRGVGTTNAGVGEEGANAFYVDGVYLADTFQTISNFNNIDRIEVLKGPQGTLFGRNATGGLVHVITRDPGPEAQAKWQIGYANYQTVTGKFYVGGPVTDNLAWDLAFVGQDQGKGWGRNLTRNTETAMSDHWGVRSKAVYRPVEALKLTLAGDFYQLKESTNAAWRLGSLGRNPSGPAFVPPSGHDTTANDLAFSDVRAWGVSLKAEADLGPVNLTSVSAVRDSRNHTTLDPDAGPARLVFFDYTAPTRTYQQELRLASSATEPLSWQAGVFYLHTIAQNLQKLRGLQFAAIGLGQDLNAKMTTDSYAVFGEVTYAITPSTHLTGGLRYTEDHRKYGGTVATVRADGSHAPAVRYPRPGIDLFSNKLKYSEVTYRVALRQDLSEDINVYASANRGFKAGAFSLGSLNNPPLKPQYIMAYEAGVKSEFFDRRLRINVSAYQYGITDYQIRSVQNSLPFLINAGKVKVQGIDTEFEAVPTQNLRLFGSFTVLKSRFKTFSGALFYYPNPATCTVAKPGVAGPGVVPGRSTGPATGGMLDCYGDASGNYTPLAPKFTGTLGASYSVLVGNGGELTFSGMYAYNGGYFFEPENRLRQPKFGVLNGTIDYRVNERWGVEFWGRNLTNKSYFVQRTSAADGDRADLAAPRTYGVNVKFNF